MYMAQWKNNNNIESGFTIIEILVAITAIVVAFTAILGFFAFEARVAERSRMRLEAISLSEEAMEAVRNFRDNTTWSSTGIGNLSTGVDFHPASSSTGWNIISGSENINGFTRKIIFNRVYRDANDNISDSGKEDNNTRKVTVTISWADRQGTTQENLITFITNWRK